MNIIFFEGFNYNDLDTIKLNPYYWSSPDINSITFSSDAHTDNSVMIPASIKASGLSANKHLDLSNFISPLSTANAFGVGFWVGTRGIRPDTRLLSFSNSGVEVLSINIIPTGDYSALDVIQNNISQGKYDFSTVAGHTYTYPGYPYRYIYQSVYLEFYVDSKNTNTIQIRVDGLDMTNESSNILTSISGFDNIDKISLYGADNDWNENRLYDDFYLTSGNSVETTLLGKDIHIYKLNPSSLSSIMEWTLTNTNNINDIALNDGDDSYCFTSISGNRALFNMNDLPISSGFVGGIMVSNTARKVANDVSFANIYASGNDQSISQFEPTYSVDTAVYKNYSSFIFKNPQTNIDWTIEDINNMQLGIKKLS